ncbi:hypothetical protein FRC18_000077 [Serendipita sp. 400]|nr:hypothetical protein FRC18_000077 [Serendipita sp. 400]
MENEPPTKNYEILVHSVRANRVQVPFMGRTKANTKRAEHRRLEAVTQNKAVPGPSNAALYEKAQSLVEQCDYELAAKFLKRILEKDQTHVDAKELFGVVLLELGDLETAEQVFSDLVSSCPSRGVVASAHLHLAQLSEGPRIALEHYQKAVDILHEEINRKPSTEGTLSIDDGQQRQTIAKALVAMTEIWLTDLCMEPEAEQSCESLLNAAIQLDPENADVLQSMASVRMSQQRTDDAKALVERSWAIWKDLAVGDASIPPVPLRLSLTRLFLELLMYKEALTVLTGVIETDDQEVEAWYLEGWCFMLMAEEAKVQNKEVEGLSWRELAKDARDCLETCVNLFDNQNHPDTEMLKHAKELMQQLTDMGITPSRVDAEGDGDDWEDVEDSEEDEDVEMDD